ncbi:hypothetical protein [Chryseobacterium geocarposphaerae]|uniref:YD repeat-containing protein n=1 Tax=Chryseobacterium geocarposphaerae TaxID=1416776 RepID=A0A2M9BXF3_9FLAO|nr:hypothetical protein [Chryseobacterium geocarposphaerae]PJJ62639.1 hypothetical protein CLV73_3824 [Chryseobacterium geocarposphaerae]
MKKIFIAIGLIAMQMYFAQDEDFLPKIIPSSPQATELGRYGNVPVGMFTGTPNVNLSIYTLKESGIEIPINITYNSSGVQVDGVAKQLGIDWNLIVGGIISRQINDMDDLVYPFHQVDTSDLCNSNSFEAATIASGSVDTEKDTFSFSFLGNSGKFFFDGNTIIQTTPSSLKIEKLAAPNNATPKFKITDIDGTEYYFGGGNSVESSFNRSHCGAVQPPVINDTAWYLTKIVTNQGQEALFNYSHETFQYNQSYYQTAYAAINAGGVFSNAVLQPPCYNELRHDASFLQEIIVNDKKIQFNYQKIDSNSNESKQLISMEIYHNATNLLKKYVFNYDAYLPPSDKLEWTNSYTNSNEKHIFLKNVKELEPNNTEIVTKYAFDYYSPDQLAPRHSFAKDIYGYLNNANNSNIIYNNLINSNPTGNNDYVFQAFKYISSNRTPNFPYTGNGMLKNIYYPTKGRTEFIYESNTIRRDKTITPGETTISDVSIAESVGYSTIANSSVFTVASNTTAKLYAVAWRECGADDPVHPPQVIVYVLNADTGATVKYFTTSGPSDTTADLQAGVNYKIQIKLSRPCLGANAFINILPAPYNITINDPAGGVRVQKTLDYDNNGNTEIKKYYYSELETMDKTTGIPSTIHPDFARNVDQFIEGNLQKLTMFSNVKNSMFSLDGYSIMYPTVIEGFGENFEKGGIVHQFYGSQDGLPAYICGNMIRGVSFSNTFLAGHELKNRSIRKNGNNFITLSSDEYTYSRKPLYDKSFDNFVAKKSEFYDQSVPGNNGNLSTTFYAVNSYQTQSEFNYLSSKKSTKYDLNGTHPVLTQTEYFYENPSHFQMSKEKVTLPEGIVSETNYQYSYEKGNQLMIERNMVGIPLETAKTQTVNGITSILSKTETIYPTSVPTSQTGNLVLPTSILSYSLQNPTTGSIEVTYDKYDLKGNVQQYTTKNGVSTTIIWGYNQTQPIAKIEGAKLSDINQALISSIVSASDTDALATINNDETAFLSVLNNFRNDPSLSAYQITTFTYDPLTGVRSITPASGIREVYIYDSANRLKEVREQNQTGKLLKEYQYNYKN